jgi:hypothetical protein
MAQEGLLEGAKMINGMLVSEDKLSQYSEGSPRQSSASRNDNIKTIDEKIELKKKLMTLKASKRIPKTALPDNANEKPASIVEKISSLANNSSKRLHNFLSSVSSKKSAKDSGDPENQNSIEDGKLAELEDLPIKSLGNGVVGVRTEDDF